MPRTRRPDQSSHCKPISVPRKWLQEKDNTTMCVTWALGREVCLPYYDHLTPMLITSPLSLLLTMIKGCYESTTSPQLPPTSHSVLLSDKVMSADSGIVYPLDSVASLASSAPTSACQLCWFSHRTITRYTQMDSYATRPSSCSHHHWRGIDLLIHSPSWHSWSIGLFATYIAIVEQPVSI
jgi:hypothetical protein